MLSLTHTLVSLPLAFYFDNPLLIFLAAIVLHLFCDTLLHWNIYPDTFRRYPYELVAIDMVLGVIVVWWLLPQHFFTWAVVAAIVGGNAPDIAHGVWDLLGTSIQQRYLAWAKPWFRFHDALQHETTSVATGLLSQVVLVAVAMVMIM